MRKLLLILALISFCMPSAYSGDFTIVPGEWWYVEDSGMTVAQLHNGDVIWEKSRWEAPNLGFSFKPYWFRMSLGKDRLAEGGWHLLIHNAILTDIRVYLEEQGTIKELSPIAGMRMPAYPFNVERNVDYTLYVRVQSNTALQLPAEIISERAFLTERESQDAIFGIFAGILFSMMLYNLVLFLTIRDRLFLLYVGHAGALMFFVCAWQGLGNAYLWGSYPEFQNMSVAFATFGVIAFSTWFCGVFLGIKTTNFKFTRTFWLVRNLGLVGLVVTPLIPAQWAVYSSSILSFFAVMLVIISMISRVSMRYRPARLFVMGWTMYVVGALAMGLNKFGLIEVTAASENLLMWGAVFDMVLLCIALGDKFHEERNIKIKAQEMAIKAVQREKNAKELAISKQQVAQKALEESARVQHNYTRLLERRVKERTLELKRTQQDLELISEQDALTHLKNRRFFEENLQVNMDSCRRTGRAFSILMVDIDHFKMVNDTYGHLAGDECIRRVGNLLQEKLSHSSGVVCRYGGEEFVLLYPAETEGEAIALAESLRAHVAKCPILCENQRIMVTVSIGVMMVAPGEVPEHADQAIERADQALYEAKSQGRNCVCIA